MTSTLIAIVFLHYRFATKIALEILVCRVRPWCFVSLPLEVSELVYVRLEGWSYFSRFSTVRVLVMTLKFWCTFKSVFPVQIVSIGPAFSDKAWRLISWHLFLGDDSAQSGGLYNILNKNFGNDMKMNRLKFTFYF